MASVARELTLVGGDTELFQAAMEEDVCFGQHYARTVEECRTCVTPVIMAGKLLLLKEACEIACKRGCGKDAAVTALKRLPSREVLERLRGGATVVEIFREILNGSDDAVGAREVLSARFWYIEQELKLPVPDLPRTRALMKEV